MDRRDGEVVHGAFREALDEGMTRRRLLKLGGMAAAAGAIGPLARPLAAAAGPGKWPSAALTEADALPINAKQFMPDSQLWAWLRELEAMGPSG